MRIRRANLIVVLALAAGCARTSPAPEGPIALAVAGLANAHATLASDGDRVAAAWTATGQKGTDIYAAVSVDSGRTFGPAVRVNDVDGDANANGEQPPRVLMRGTAVDVLWVSKRAGVSGIRAAASSDGGATFTPARSITPGGLSGLRGWQSATLGPDGEVHAVWLDGRNAPSPSNAPRASAPQAAPPKEARPAGAPHRHGAMRQDIYHAAWKGTGPAVETAVASNVCFCCKTAVVNAGSHVYVAWRHLFPGGVRDIALARSGDGGRTFGDPVRVSEDNWQLDACPDDGPAMTIDGEGALHVAWPTLVTGPGGPRIGIFEATSRDNGATFSARTRVDTGDGGPAHPKIAAGGGRRAVVWDEIAEGRRRVLFRPADGTAVPLGTSRIGSYPAIAAVRDAFVVAWTDQSDELSVIRALIVR